QRLVAAVRGVDVEGVRVVAPDVLQEQLLVGHYLSLASSSSTFAASSSGTSSSLTCAQVAVSQAPRHSTNCSEKRPSGVTWPRSMPSFCSRRAITSCEPRSMHDSVRQIWMWCFPTGLRWYIV